MKLRKLGRTNIEIAPLVFGGNVFGWTVDETTSFDLLDAFVERGYNAIDSADVYSVWGDGNEGGESETVIGRWLERRGRRDDVVIFTKVGWEIAPDRKGLSRDYILRSVEDSLRRLKTDYIDVYFSHKPDPETPIEETLEAHRTLIEDGKVRWAGASNYDARQLAAALAAGTDAGRARYQVLQPEYNLYDRAGYEEALEPLAADQGLGVVTYFSLASGFLTGKYRSASDFEGRTRGSRAEKYMDERGRAILGALDEVAGEHGAKPAQIALAWVQARDSITAPIASATSLDQLGELMGAADVDLGEASLDRLDRASQPEAAGASAG
jgi:aryl-alcohol dehydrogenase-like predicted oxidoreductase